MDIFLNAGCGSNHTSQSALAQPLYLTENEQIAQFGYVSNDNNCANAALNTQKNDTDRVLYTQTTTFEPLHRMMWAYATTAPQPQPLDTAAWQAILNNPDIPTICQKIEDKFIRGEKYADLKQQLPVLMPHAWGFRMLDDNGNLTMQLGGKRTAATAVPNGLVMLDIDHVYNPEELFTKFGGNEAAKTNEIAYVGITPSKVGLRVIAQRQWEESIADAQRRLAQLFQSDYDKVTTDLSRCSYCVPANYILYLDTELFYFKNIEERNKIVTHFAVLDGVYTPQHANEQNQNNNLIKSNKSMEKTFSAVELQPQTNQQAATTIVAQQTVNDKLDFQGIPVRQIAEYIAKQFNDGNMPKQGNRNNTYMEMAKACKSICDYDAALLYANLPDLGLDTHERASICKRFTDVDPKFMTSKTPQKVIEAVEEIRKNKIGLDNYNNAALDMDPDNVPVPEKLPKIWQTICSTLDPEFHWPAIIATLPLLGAVATNVRLKYTDNQLHALSFQSYIVGDQSIGKGFYRKTADLILKPLREHDTNMDINRANYLRLKRNNPKKEITEPIYAPRITSIKMSPTMYFDIQQKLGEQFMIAISEEIDQMINAEKSSSMSLRDIYKYAFDNEWASCEYRSENSFAGKVKVFFNFMVTCTYDKLHELFDKNLTDGLMTRACVAQLKRELGEEQPFFEDYTEQQVAYIDELTVKLDKIKGFVFVPWVYNTIAEMSKEWNRKVTTLSNGKIIDQIFKRALVKAFRAGYLAAICEGDYFIKNEDGIFVSSNGEEVTYNAERADRHTLYEYNLTPNRQMIIDFTKAVFEYLLRTTYQLFGANLETQVNKWQQLPPQTPIDMLASLPQVFTHDEFINIAKAAGRDNSQASKILNKWTGVQHKVVKNPNGTYTKITNKK